ncbi:MAG: F0F1 ATP synthase subunit A [Nitrospirae bacterium]|nr:F0F1 ATP synthase subunit A [Nitrospirota bacterium]
MGPSDLLIGTEVQLGPVVLAEPVLITWGIMLALTAGSWIVTRRLSLDPGPAQVVLEGLLDAADEAIRAVLPAQTTRLLPFITTLWLFIMVANLSGLIPGVHAPTANLSTTAALAVLVFLSVHWFGIHAEGLRPYLRHYLAPMPLMLPFHLMSELTRTLALAIRLFGNIMSLEMAALLVLLVAGFLVPIPLLMLHIIEALIQAYIFGMLALIYIAGAIHSQQSQQAQNRSNHA